MSRDKAFTIIELLVVISIIGLLSSIIMFSISNARQKARDTWRLASIRSVVTALNATLLDKGQFPYSTLNGCGGWDVGNKTLPWMMLNGASTLGEYMPQPPRDPVSTGNCNGFRYYRYDAGSFGCAVSRGAYFVILVDMETVRTYPGSPGWSCPARNWQSEASWATGQFEN